MLLGQRASDLTGSYRLYRKAALARIMAANQAKGYAFQMENIVRASSMGYSVEDVRPLLCLPCSLWFAALPAASSARTGCCAGQQRSARASGAAGAGRCAACV